MADHDVLHEELTAYDSRLATDHGIPAVLHGIPDGGYQERGTLVRVTEPGNYYLHLVQAADGRVWAGFTTERSTFSVVPEEELEGEAGG